MMLRRSIPVVTTLTTLVWPLAALAINSGTVTTGPANAAPTLTLPLLGLLALVLTGIAGYQLRRSSVRRSVALVLLAAVMVGLGYAGMAGVTIDGPDCARQTTKNYNPNNSPIILTNNCPNSIYVLGFQTSCVDPPPLSQPCSVGQTLASGDTCLLPSCNI